MNEIETRNLIVAEAQAWINTPYLSNAMVKGAGIDCAMLLVAVYREVGLIPPDLDPRPYAPMWHLHQKSEEYKNIVERFAKEIAPPPAREPRPGDVVLFRIGRLFAHGGIITCWPKIIHARAPNRCWEEDVHQDRFGKHALWRSEMKFYSCWD
jgi:cell wall-associated NlpC family hydrolase